MAEQQRTDEHTHATAPPPSTRTRRGLIAGAAALAAATLARQARQEVGAQGEALIVGNGVNSPGYQSATAITWLAGTVSGKPALRVTNNTALVPTDVADGVQGYAANANNAGLYGRNDQVSGVGVHAEAQAGTGVFGYSGNGPGVTGQTASNVGVYGVGGSGYGVYASGGTAGVYGSPSAVNGAGVLGITGTNGTIGVQGSVVAGVTAHAVVGTGTTSGYAGVLGQTGTAGAYGVYGAGSVAGSYAGYFLGKVTVQGDFNVTGSKSAVVPHPDGVHRTVYCVEAPEAWFEDFGEGRLAGGTAHVALDPDFAAISDTRALHVFLTPYDAGSKGLAVEGVRPDGFTVRELQGGVSNGRFAYRVVARRKDNPGTRLAKATLPQGVARVAEPRRAPMIATPKVRTP